MGYQRQGRLKDTTLATVILCFTILLFPLLNLVDIRLYSDFYAHLETEINEELYWDQESRSKAQGLFHSCGRFDRLVALAALFNGLEPLKPLVTRVWRRNQDIYNEDHVTGQVISDLKAILKTN